MHNLNLDRRTAARKRMGRLTLSLVMTYGLLNCALAWGDSSSDAPTVVDIAQVIRYSLEKFGPVP